MRRCCVKPAPCLLSILLALATIVRPSARAQEEAVKFVPRQDMIDAIMRHAGSGSCDTVRNVLGPVFEVDCEKPGQGPGIFTVVLALHSQPDQALIEICKRHALRDCEAQKEVSTGRPVLAFDTSLRVDAREGAAWSPDSRQLVIYAAGRRGQTRLIDVEQRKLGPIIAKGSAPSAVAWSPDGKYIALGAHQFVPGGPTGIRLYASDTLEEKGSLIAARENKCDIRSQQMAFTMDSTALWIDCGGPYGAPSHIAIAAKLRVPSLEIEDRLFPTSAAPDTRFRTYEILRRDDDLVLMGISRPVRLVRSDNKHQMAIQSFSLRTMKPLHPPVSVPLYNEDGNSRRLHNARLAHDRSAVLLHFYGTRSHPEAVELWSTEGGGRVEVGPPIAMRDRHPRKLIAASGLHVRARAITKSSRANLIVLDSRSGATVQEIGPVPGVAKILVSPDGTRVAIFGLHTIRFYRVTP